MSVLSECISVFHMHAWSRPVYHAHAWSRPALLAHAWSRPVLHIHAWSQQVQMSVSNPWDGSYRRS